jgi:hypothetical protein
MSCTKCEEAIREMGYDKDGKPTMDPELMAGESQPVPIFYSYIRVGNANVLIAGCRDHMQQLVEIYRTGLKYEP